MTSHPQATFAQAQLPLLHQAREGLLSQFSSPQTPGMSNLPNISDNHMLKTILEQLRKLVRAESIQLYLVNGEHYVQVFELGYRKPPETSHSNTKRAVYGAHPVVYDAQQHTASVALFAQGHSIGKLCIYRTASIHEADMRVLTAMGNLIASALFDHQRFKQEQEQLYTDMLEGWIGALELRDNETKEHTQRVTIMTVELANEIGISDANLMHVRRGALLHDIGKIAIPDSILLKPGALNPEEWRIMRKHPQYAHDLLNSIPFLQPALDIPYYHHEKWDGSGYPHKLQGQQIPLAARIFALVDVWDALRFDRPYREAWPEWQVRRHIESLAGTHFDPELVPLFLNHLQKKPAIFSRRSA
jgi:putative nucleotidyltransferase with HDIG domain